MWKELPRYQQMSWAIYALDLPQRVPIPRFSFWATAPGSNSPSMLFPQHKHKPDETTVSLDEVAINATEDPAYRIIRATIA
ncbi:MAG: hypothetical protein R2773_05820 [Flavobacteriaceae bacterium]